MQTIFIDVREPDEYATGHVKNALNIPPYELMDNPKALEKIPKDASIVLYCRSGARSNVAMQILRSRGYTHLTNGINKDQVAAKFQADIQV